MIELLLDYEQGLCLDGPAVNLQLEVYFIFKQYHGSLTTDASLKYRLAQVMHRGFASIALKWVLTTFACPAK